MLRTAAVGWAWTIDAPSCIAPTPSPYLLPNLFATLAIFISGASLALLLLSVAQGFYFPVGESGWEQRRWRFMHYQSVVSLFWRPWIFCSTRGFCSIPI